MEWLFDPQSWVALITLVALEIVLGIDNIVFLTILSGRLPEDRQVLARRLGLIFAMVTRLLLLLSLAWLMTLTQPLFTLFEQDFSGRDVILIAGGLFLLAKSTSEIYENIEDAEDEQDDAGKQMSSVVAVIIQIALIDIVFSLDSVITAVGMVNQIYIMMIAIIIAVMVMMLAVEAVNTIINSHPSIKILALSFLLMVGFVLIADGLGLHVPKGYIYFAMAFSVFIEMINIRMRKVKGRI
jgi:predicted tellurium resistance membrane protein TerC